MASIGHVVIGALAAPLSLTPEAQASRPSATDTARLATARSGGATSASAGGERARLGLRVLWLSALSLLPDADVLAFRFGIPYEHPFGHRGATHSLAFAVLGGLVALVLAGRLRLPRRRTAITVGLVLASHGLLDMLTDGGLGVALLFPFDSTRLFFAWRPLPVAPIGRALLGAWGARVALVELLWLSPLLAWALVLLARARRRAPSPVPRR